jgi:hypothetical protein
VGGLKLACKDAEEGAWLGGVNAVILVNEVHAVSVQSLQLRLVEFEAHFEALAQGGVAGQPRECPEESAVATEH